MSLLTLLTGCAQLFYNQTPTGRFYGRLYVEWIAPNQFIYRPDTVNPLTYIAADGLKIAPQAMYTDGGSIPRLFWSSPGLGPWDFGPGYIVHDWLFEQHHCKSGSWGMVTFEKSASLLAEAMKTQMEKADHPDATIVYAVHAAVSSKIARGLWDDGACHPVPAKSAAPGAPEPIQILVIDVH